MRTPCPAGRLREIVRGEYLEMPGLCLTLPQAARLWGTEHEAVQTLLDDLVQSGFLRLTREGRYARGSGMTKH